MSKFGRIWRESIDRFRFVLRKVPKNSEKYSGSVKERKKEVSGHYIRYGIIFILWCALILLAIQVDKEYYNRYGGIFSGIVALLAKKGHAWGIDYTFLYEALGGYSSILLTVVGMIVTGWLSLSERLEQTVYGIRRRELLANSFAGKCMVDSFIGVFFTPVWMMYAVIRRYCFTAYFIIGLIFLQFLLSNILLAFTYSRNQDYIRINKKIVYNMKNAVRAENFDNFDKLLDRIEVSLEENTDWNEMNTLFLAGIREAEIKEAHELYRICNKFLTAIYAKRNRERITDLARFCIQEIDRGYRAVDEEKTELMYLTVLDCLWQHCTEKQICLCVNRLLDMFSLNGVSDYAGVNLPVVWLEDIFAMIALQMEYWLQANDSKQKSFKWTFCRLIELGESLKNF